MATKREGVACYDKAELDEPIFVLRAHDLLSDGIVNEWANWAERHGVNPAKVADARKCAEKMRQWPNRKMPD